MPPRRAHHQEFVGHVLRPDFGLMMHHRDLQPLPGGECVALVGVARLIGQRVAGIIPFLAVGTMGHCRKILRDLVVGDEAPTLRAFDPEAQHKNLVAVDDDGDHLAVILGRLRKAGLIAERRLGQHARSFRFVENAPVAIHPNEIVVEQGRGGVGVAVRQRSHQSAVAMQYGFVHGRGYDSGTPGTGGVPWVWNDLMVCRPHAWPFLRSASLQRIGFQSGARTRRAPGQATSTRLPPGS